MRSVDHPYPRRWLSDKKTRSISESGVRTEEESLELDYGSCESVTFEFLVRGSQKWMKQMQARQEIDETVGPFRFGTDLLI